ncbi:redoxin family protein [Flavobacterium sp. NST-5]|uniref:Redoxin family protein n=1 Tax=Flavobacterium ichthyis TaxID=2698827 RepID=A0ABW9Z9S8_9FLAO|nr:TlpA disulfide reductase family protein [Flavobacterium ichthyis]NBL64092.1 redoxin family protein [Flavobacterium ichthyis]
MKKIFATLVCILAMSSCSQAQKTEFAPEALSENLLDLNGNEISFQEILNQHKGKTILIDVWASWCSDCIKAMPKFKEMQTKNPKAVYVYISMDKTAEKWKTGIEKYNLGNQNQYLAKDGMKGVFGKAIDLDWIPRYIVVDKKGKIVIYRAIEKDFDKLNATLKKLK